MASPKMARSVLLKIAAGWWIHGDGHWSYYGPFGHVRQNQFTVTLSQGIYCQNWSDVCAKWLCGGRRVCRAG